jgi:hypothetical protein
MNIKSESPRTCLATPTGQKRSIPFLYALVLNLSSYPVRRELPNSPIAETEDLRESIYSPEERFRVAKDFIYETTARRAAYSEKTREVEAVVSYFFYGIDLYSF